MKRPIIYLSLFLAVLFVVIIAGAGVPLVELVARLHPAAGWLVGLILAAVLLIGLLSTACFLFPIAGRFNPPKPGSWRHRRYLARLARRHRRRSVTSLHNLPAGDAALVEAIYQRLDKQTNALIASTAETVFFHTAISQAGHMDVLVTLGAQIRLVRQLARLYHPRPGMHEQLPLYRAMAQAALWPGSREEVDLGAQIGPAIVGASVVGAIPGANLVSLIIADAVIQGSANALAAFRIGLLTRRYFHHRLQGSSFQAAAERQAVNREALDLLAALVPGASGALSKEIWDAAKDNLRRMPAATYDSLKSLVARSVRGLGRPKGILSDIKGDQRGDEGEGPTDTPLKED